MDATTKQKTVTSFLVTLLLASVFAVMAPVASANHASGGSVADANVAANAPTTMTVEGVTFTSVATITTGAVRYNATYDLDFTKIAAASTAPTTGYGYAATSSAFCLVSPKGHYGGNPRNAATATDGTLTVTFPSMKHNASGRWTLVAGATTDPVSGVCLSGGSLVLSYVVQPELSLTVSLSQSTFTYSTAQVGFTVTVSPLAADQSATLKIGNPPFITSQVTGPTGAYPFFGPTPEAGTHDVNASRNFVISSGAEDIPEVAGSTTLSVSANTITATGVDTTPKTGFSGASIWNITYPNGTAVFCVVAGSCASNLKLVNYNLTVTGPTVWGTMFTNSTATSGPSVMHCAPAASACVSAPGNVTWSYNGFGNFSFAPGATWWAAGAYSFTLVVNQVGAAGSLPEFSGSWTFTPATPAAINVDVKGVASGFPHCTTGTVASCLGATPAVLKNLSVIENMSTVGPSGSYTLSVVVTGTTETQHPRCVSGCGSLGTNTWTDVDTLAAQPNFAKSNVTVTGDVIVNDSTAFSYDQGTGIALLPGIIPTKYGGNVVITVTWKGTTLTTTLPIVKGAVITADKNELVVDKADTITFTVVDQGGTPVPDARVLVWAKPSGSASVALGGAVQINGTGDAGAGQGGKYTLTLTPTAIGKYIVYTQIGHEPATAGASDTRRFAYAEFSVVPAHDVNVTLTPTQSMAGLPTAYRMNATIADGRSLGTTAQIYLLTPKQKADFQTNLSLVGSALSTGPATLVTGVNPALGTAAGSGVVNYFWNSTLNAGDYYVYICGNAGGGALAANCADAKHDNNQSIPLLNISRYMATFTPSEIADNVDVQKDTNISILVTDRNGVAVNGTLAWAAGPGAFLSTNRTGGTNGVTPTISIVNGVGTIQATGKTAGDIMWTFMPTGGVAYTADDNFKIVGPNIAVNPDRIPVGQTTTVTMTVKTLAGVPLAGRNIRICGSPIGGPENPPNTLGYTLTGGQNTLSTVGCTGNATTNVDGIATLGVFPNSNGLLHLYLNDSRTATTITVFAGLQITYTPAAPVAGDTVQITVKQVGASTGLSGVNVSITKNGTAVSGFPQVTGSNGVVVLSNVQEGTYAVTANKTGFDQANETIVVGKQPTTPVTSAKFELSNLVAPTSAVVGQALSVSADLANTGEIDGTATLLLLVNGQVRDTRAIPVVAGGKETIGFDFTPTQAGTFKVTVKLSTGETLAEKTVTVTTPTTTTSTTTSTTTTSTTTTTTTTSPTPKVPGFEVVALLGALAVALLVLRRRS